ncbi:ornithine carbamoyltransferase [Myxococcota bacterium]|nr:ornithine carbamoyltransferase [Myxococcota bacterium]
MRHYLTELDLTVEETRALLADATRLKAERKRRAFAQDLAGHHVALYFEKPSVRTRVSFTVGVHELGGHVVELGGSNTKVGKGEDVADFAKVVGRYASILVARVFEQQKLETMAEFSGVPVVNALSDERHPCQALADVLTIQERFGRLDQTLEGLKFTFVGEGNNVAASTGLLCQALGAHVVVAAPEGYGLKADILEAAKKIAASKGGGALEETHDVVAAAKGADVLYTDTWVSMGQEEEAKVRREKFKGFKIDGALLGRAKPNAIVMHCLPAVRDEEIETAVMYSPASALWDEAENRLHVQKALLRMLLRSA